MERQFIYVRCFAGQNHRLHDLSGLSNSSPDFFSASRKKQNVASRVVTTIIFYLSIAYRKSTDATSQSSASL